MWRRKELITTCSKAMTQDGTILKRRSPTLFSAAMGLQINSKDSIHAIKHHSRYSDLAFRTILNFALCEFLLPSATYLPKAYPVILRICYGHLKLRMIADMLFINVSVG